MRIFCALLTGLSLLLPAIPAGAEDFPARQIRLIVPFPPGGPNDIIARVIGQRMSEIAKQTVIIDNRGGQGGVLGTEALAKATPDGYTIAISSAGALAIRRCFASLRFAAPDRSFFSFFTVPPRRTPKCPATTTNKRRMWG